MTKEEASALVELVNVELCTSAMTAHGFWAVAEEDPRTLVHDDVLVVTVFLYGLRVLILRDPPCVEAVERRPTTGRAYTSNQWENLKWRIGL